MDEYQRDVRGGLVSGSSGVVGLAGLGKASESLPVWARVHRDLDAMRETLMKCREEAQARGRAADREIQDIDNALNRINPPLPEAIGPSAPPVPTDYPRRW
jgi:hypothetical protein